MEQQQTFTIHLPQFEGPFDLLLFFIERDELDIHDIPISQITDEFLAYLRHMESMNIDLASEFILVAATLCRIKARLLLPRKEVDEEGNEVDPREELVRRLLEYKRYKSVLDELRALEENQSLKTARGSASRELQEIATKALVDVELESVTLFKLLKAYERVMQRFDEQHTRRTVHQVLQYPYTIQSQQEYIFSRIPEKGQVSFEAVFNDLESRMHAIVTFLALLELLNLQMVQIIQGLGYNNFWLVHPPSQHEEPDFDSGDE
jgi:segregation and condensation protein A